MRLLMPIVALILVALAANSVFIVREGRSALLLQFGRIEGGEAGGTPDYKPGLHFKIPLAQQVVRYDRRILNLEAKPDRLFTSEKKAVIVDFYAKWKIVNAATYYQAFGEDPYQTLAEQRLTSRIRNALRDEFNARPLNELIASARSDITEKVLEAANQSTIEPLGIRIVDVRVKRIEFPDEVVGSVYDRMRAERQRLANEQRSNGREEAAKITADADRQVRVINAEAERDAQRVRGEGDAKATDIYAAAYSKDPEFYAFYRSLDAYRAAFKSGDVMLLDSKSEFLRYFGEPDAKGK